MKSGTVTKPEGEGLPWHEHPREEPFSLVIPGQTHFVQDELDHVGAPVP